MPAVNVLSLRTSTKVAAMILAAFLASSVEAPDSPCNLTAANVALVASPCHLPITICSRSVEQPTARAATRACNTTPAGRTNSTDRIPGSPQQAADQESDHGEH